MVPPVHVEVSHWHVASLPQWTLQSPQLVGSEETSVSQPGSASQSMVPAGQPPAAPPAPEDALDMAFELDTVVELETAAELALAPPEPTLLDELLAPADELADAPAPPEPSLALDVCAPVGRYCSQS